ncbi:MAG: hypothetical protein NTW48_09995 [Chloroflexi bacterium]|nr:hypothetical protein [Chloroflexota bacterium]
MKIVKQSILAIASLDLKCHNIYYNDGQRKTGNLELKPILRSFLIAAGELQPILPPE